MKSLSLTKPHLLVIAGIPGAGKSFFAEKFAEMFNSPLVSSDRIQNISSVDQSIVSQLVLDQLSQLLMTKSTVIVDGASDTRTERLELSKIARANGYDMLIIWVQTDLPTAKYRILSSAKRGENKSQITTSEQYDKSFNRFTNPNSTENYIVISGKHTYATQAKVILKKLTESRGIDREILKTTERPPKASHQIVIR